MAIVQQISVLGRTGWELPPMDDAAAHVDEIGAGARHGRKERIAMGGLIRLVDGQSERFHSDPLHKCRRVVTGAIPMLDSLILPPLSTPSLINRPLAGV